MLTCTEVLRQLPHFVSGELTSEESLRINSHVMSCFNCLLALSSISQTQHNSSLSPRGKFSSQ